MRLVSRARVGVVIVGRLAHRIWEADLMRAWRARATLPRREP
jgi:hypothetical protein